MKKFFTSLFLLITFSSSVTAEQVTFNTQNKKVHKSTCEWAKKCKKNCTKIERTEAYKKGGVKCKTCGG